MVGKTHSSKPTPNINRILFLSALLFTFVDSRNTSSLQPPPPEEIPIKQISIEQAPHVLPNLSARPTIFSFHGTYLWTSTTPDDRGRPMLPWVTVWKSAWEKAGWNPIVFSIADLRDEEILGVDSLDAAMDSHGLEPEEMERFYRWAVMAHVVPEAGAWMSDVDVLPLHVSLEDGLRLPDDGRFTFYDGEEDSLASGSRAEWGRMLEELRRVLEEGGEGDPYERFAREVRSSRRDEVRPGYAKDGEGRLDCSFYSKEVKAVHFSASPNTAVLGGWLQQSLREYYGSSIDLKFKHKYNVRTKDVDLRSIDVIMNGESIGNARENLISLHRTDIADSFMSKIFNECPV